MKTSRYKTAQECLKAHNIRPSLHRLAVIEYLMNNAAHPTAEEIFSSLYSAIPTLSRTTVYNILKLLAEKKAAISLDIDPRQAHYDGDTSLHSHFICLGCGAIEDMESDAGLLSELTRRKYPSGMLVERVELNYRGICRKCLSKEQKPAGAT